MANVAFIGNGVSAAALLETFRRFTPGNTGVWKNLKGVPNVKQADYVVIIDRPPGRFEKQVPRHKWIMLGAHPETNIHYNSINQMEGCCRTIDMAYEFGFGEWWIKYDYDYLKALEPPDKTEYFGAIVSDSRGHRYHNYRRNFLEKFCTNFPGRLNLYGRIKPWSSLVPHHKGVCGQAAPSGGDYWYGKEPVYESHRYMLEMDVPGAYYFSERVFDCLLLWAMPIYWGGDGIWRYLPEDAFRLFDIYGNGSDVMDMIADAGLYEQSISAIRQARELLLDKYQIWPRIHESLYNEP